MNKCCFSQPIDSGPRSNGPLLDMPRFEVLGIRLHAMTKEDLLTVIVQAVTSRSQCVIANHNMHSLHLWTLSAKMREFYSMARYVQIDGMPVVWLGRLFGVPLRHEHRTTAQVLLPSLFEEARKRHWRIFYLGSRPGVAVRGARTLQIRFPGLQMATRDGYFDASQTGKDNQSVLADIRSYAPDILMLGMGMPRQEVWAAENLKEISAPVVLCCGGLMDLVAGEIPSAPSWLGPVGLEWLFRLLSQPTRVWRRYLLEPWLILLHVCKHYLRSGQLSLPALDDL